MKQLSKAALAAATLLAATPLTALADGSLYLGGSIGSASLDEEFDGFDVDTDTNAFRIVAGWQFNDYFSLEGGYHHFGTFEQDFETGVGPVRLGLEADGFTLGATGTLPLGDKFAIFGRVGSFFWDGDAEINDVSQAQPEDTNLYIGIGGKFAVSHRFSLLGDWTAYELEDSRSNVLSIGFAVYF